MLDVGDVASMTTYGPGFYMPEVVVGSPGGLLVSFLTQVTSGANKVTPTGYTELYNDEEALGDRGRCSLWTRAVTSGSYGGEGYGNSGEAGNTQGVTTIVLLGESLTVLDSNTTADGGIIHPTASISESLAL